MNILKAIRDKRKEKGISQEEMAAKLFYAGGTYRDIESEKIRLTLDNYLRICEILEIKPSTLISEDKTYLLSDQELETLSDAAKIILALKNKQNI